jgi:NAD(P)-dependent dehydrogenase (short-subunit alcohol dehydrogenase family)
MQNLLLIGASNYLAQELIHTLPSSTQIVGVAIEEDTDRHREYMALEIDNLKKEILDITQNGLTWLDNLIDKYGDFDGLVYVPCENAKKDFLDITPEDFDKAVNINGKLPFFISQKLIPGMQSLGHGRFIFIGTIWSIKGHPDRGNDYAVTKVMENQLAKQITAVYMDKNITATNLIFGSVNLHQESRDEEPLFSEEDRVISHQEMSEYITTLLNENKRSFAGTTVLMDNGTLSIAGVSA